MVVNRVYNHDGQSWWSIEFTIIVVNRVYNHEWSIEYTIMWSIEYTIMVVNRVYNHGGQ